MLQSKKLNLISLKDGRLLISDFSYNVKQNDKTVIIGEEGNGKSSLLKFLYSEDLVSDYLSFSGEVIRNGKFGYLPQFIDESDKRKALAEFFKDIDIYTHFDVVNELGLSYDMLLSEQPISTLSGGEKIKIQLLKILCEEPDLLFLDEPSNDLDIDTLSFLEDFIRNCPMPVIYISHDETLIENTATSIIHIEQLIRKTKCKITISRLSYRDYLCSRKMLFIKQRQVALNERSAHKKKMDRLRQLYEKAKHNSGWKHSDGTPSSDGRAKKSMQSIKSKENRLNKESENFTEIPDREEEIITRFDYSVSIPNGKKILQLHLDTLEIGSRVLSRCINLSVTGGEHICIIGKNGVGKSTLLKEIWAILKKRDDIVAGYMPQDYSDVIDFEETPIEYLEANYTKEEVTKARMFMGNMKFTSEEMTHKIAELSGGQKAKLIFLNMVLKKCNVLILDEPTRNFSPLSAPVVRKALIDFKGTIISISHDRKYLDEVADIIYVLTPDGLNPL